MQCGVFQGRIQQQRVQLVIVLDVRLLLTALHLVERRLSNVDVATFDQHRYLTIEEREQQRPDVRAVHVRVRHDDDAVIAQLVDVELVASYSAAQSRDQRTDLGRRYHLVETGFLDIQDLAFQRQDGL